jgi:DNA-binding NarL/FixJ family response regulator
VIFLIAEDYARMRESLKRVLNASIPGVHAILEAADGEAAVEMYRRHRPDWVLMDIMMEPVDGLTAARTILAADAKARIVFVTGYDDPAYRKSAEKVGARGYVLKDRLADIAGIVCSAPSQRHN